MLGRNCRFLQFRPDGTRDDQPEARAALRNAVDTGTATVVQLRNYCKDGTLFYNRLFLNPVHAEGGTLVGFVGVQNDITELVESQEDAEQQEQLLEAFFESAPFAMGVIELTEGDRMQHLAGNAVARRLLEVEGGGAPDGLFSEELGFPEDEDHRWRKALQACRTTGGPVRFSTAFPWGSDAQGEETRHLDVVVNAADDEHPIFSYVAQDVTERRHSERERVMLQQAVASSPQGVLITKADLDAPGPEIVYANAAYGQITGYEPDELVGGNPRVVQGPKTDRAVLDRLRRQLEAGEHFEGEAVNYRKDGSEFILRWDIAPIYDASGRITHWTSSHRDVTERRRLELEVLEVASREQERIAHDLHDGLGQTIAAASMLSATVAEDLQDDRHAAAETVGRIRDMLQDAVRQTRALAHGLHPANVRADGLMQALAHLAESASGAYGVSCTFSCEEPVLMSGHDRTLHLYRIVQEAITNAVRHGQARTIAVTLDAAADEHPGVPEGSVSLSIQDDGRGISAHEMETADGLGLRSMRYRTERIGGTLSIRALEKGGTLVHVLFDPSVGSFSTL